MGLSTNLRHGLDANEWAPLRTKMENLVAFRGRTSGWVLGVMNPALSILNRFADGTAGEEYGLSDENPSYSWALVNRSQEEFAARGGDSGSIVLLDQEYPDAEEARWVGILFAEGGSGVGYMTPIEPVFEDIERVTGFKVIEPALRSY